MWNFCSTYILNIVEDFPKALMVTLHLYSRFIPFHMTLPYMHYPSSPLRQTFQFPKKPRSDAYNLSFNYHRHVLPLPKLTSSLFLSPKISLQSPPNVARSGLLRPRITPQRGKSISAASWWLLAKPHRSINYRKLTCETSRSLYFGIQMT